MVLMVKFYLWWSGKNVFEVVVIGVGIFGVWIVFYLNWLGVKVILLDVYGFGNLRVSLGGEICLI